MQTVRPFPLAPSPLATRRRTAEPWVRHACLLAPVALCAALAFAAARQAAPGHGLVPVLYALLVAVNIGLLALSAVPGLLGAAVAALRPWGVAAGPGTAPPTGQARTAILVPIYEEDPVRVFAAVAVMGRSLARERLGAAEIFVLSDTQRPDLAAAEADSYARLLASGDLGVPVHYRRRLDNARRKTGNIADWCERWGADHDFMAVLDADSLMTGAAIAELVGAMEATPNAGIIQSMVYATGRHSLFARVQQFGARLYGPLLAQGVAFWQGPRGSYWGHNAIIRVAPFMAHCGLPALPGRAPLGGEVLCHDTVEAALMLRAGWDVWLLPQSAGSFEETPTNMVDHLVRDRRWCQGNLQHITLLRTDGLRLASLVHLGNGIAHYLGAPLFIALMAVTAAMEGHWAAAGGGTWLAGLALALMFGPKLLSLGAVLIDPAQSARFGGRTALIASALLDTVYGVLAGPVNVAFYTLFTATTLMGRVVRWDAQARDDRGLGWRETAQRLGLPLALAAMGAVGAWMAGAAWVGETLLPGLALAVPLAVWSSRSGVGQWTRRAGLFLTPEDTAPLPELRALPVAEAALRAQDVRAALPALPPEQRGRMVLQVLRRARAVLPAQTRVAA